MRQNRETCELGKPRRKYEDYEPVKLILLKELKRLRDHQNSTQVTVKRVTSILIIKPTRWTNFSNLFWNKTLHVSDSSSVHHQEFGTVHTAMVYVIQVCWQLASGIRMFRPDPARKLSANLYDIYYCCVYSAKLLMMDRGTVRNV